MDLPGLRESIKEFELIGGKKMEKPKDLKIEVLAEGIKQPEYPPLIEDPIDEIFSLLAALEARYRKIQAQAESDRDAFRKILEGLQCSKIS